MKVLAVDTSSTVAAVAVMEDGVLRGEYSLNNGLTHSQRLMPMVEELLSSLGLKPGDIDIYAASSGPGSFTGLRIGITTIKAMAYAGNKPVVSVPTLDALACGLPFFNGLVCPIMDARNRQVFTALYKPERISGYLGITVEELVALILEKNMDVVFTGDAVSIHRKYLTEALGARCHFAPPALMLHRAAAVAQLAAELAAEGKTESCYDLEPFYLRKPQAEREYDKKRNKAEAE
ncbi:MAG: tRNA (adenosine(37)-N6)-threonylcarbamoyltransferase complex dimerization subunit type 1 TsaB [Clostridiales bacterium]|nr:tRNA (adenosine(37)-N6)-threonylcarbamoyltransferase complex dimerization subunit type 1 TsaB [Clostridiales bacterium]